jgi:glucose/arabinose dehydrogenase
MRHPILRSSAAALAAFAGAAQAQQLTTVRLASGLSRPLFVCSPPGDTNRLFIVEQRGSAGVATRGDIRILNLATNTINATPFLSVTGLSISTEQGLLGLAFDPNYANNGFFYVDYTNSAGTSIISRYHVSANPDVADATSAVNVLTQAQPFNNHNGGWLAFGPDGYLYIAFGDGGNACDVPYGNAQNLNTLLGKLLRIDVSTLPYSIPASNPFVGQANVRGEIWDYGLRNPWRNSFDRATGELYIADVGQDAQEEIDVEPALSGGHNYGWACREGYGCVTGSSSCSSTPPAICPACTIAGAVDPVWAYPHIATPGNCAVTGGYVYRGCVMPALRGTYFFSDYCSAQIWTFNYAGGPVASVVNHTSELAVAGFTINAVTSFGEDSNGELYIVDQGSTANTGEIYRIIPRCYANCDGSTTSPSLNVLDFSCFLNAFAAGDCYANCDKSTTPPVLNVLDFGCFLNAFAAGTCP